MVINFFTLFCHRAGFMFSPCFRCLFITCYSLSFACPEWLIIGQYLPDLVDFAMFLVLREKTTMVVFRNSKIGICPARLPGPGRVDQPT